MALSAGKQGTVSTSSLHNPPPCKGLDAVSEEIRDLLPLECRRAFDGAAAGSSQNPDSEGAARVGKDEIPSAKALKV